MARPNSRPPGADDDAPESLNLLSHNPGHTSPQEEDDSDDNVIIHAGAPTTPAAKRSPLPLQISLPPPPALSAHDAAAAADYHPHRTPRTPNRVRFDLTPTIVAPPRDDVPTNMDEEHHHYARESFDMDIDEEDPLAGRSGGGRTPLLTGMEAPSVTLAAEEERSRPKSGLRMAFMNMANSIIGAGIIGQPYAFRQAGLVAGTVLLVVLTVVVDWTICLIVVNSKLSGASSFQGTVERCFGRPGLVAISVAQWVFAFGGMVAFGVIVGDSIPHVLRAVWPGLKEMPVLGVLADRRVVIAVFTMGVSYPLALYRDIAKVSLSEGGGGGGGFADDGGMYSWQRRAPWRWSAWR